MFCRFYVPVCVMLAAASLFGAASASQATEAVTVDNFTRAESDLYMSNMVKEGGLGKLFHHREPASVEHQTVIRLNRDTLYSSAIIDLDAGPVTVTLPDAGARFMSLMALNQDHYAISVTYGGVKTFTRQEVGTRYLLVGVRTFVDPKDAGDVVKVHALQDAIKIEQPGGPGAFEVPAWDHASQNKVRDALLVLASTIPNFSHAFGAKNQVDPIRHLVGTAAGWGGNPDKDAIYLNITPARNDGRTTYRLEVADVPVDGFWSISLYNSKGYYEKNPYNAYALNNVTAHKNANGAYSIQFGGCDGKVHNCLPIMAGWNYTVRLYRPRQAILDGKWTFPDAQPVN